MRLVKILLIFGSSVVTFCTTEEIETDTTATTTLNYGESETFTEEIVEQSTDSSDSEIVESITVVDTTILPLQLSHLVTPSKPPKPSSASPSTPKPVANSTPANFAEKVRVPISVGGTCDCGIPKIKSYPSHSTRVIGGQPAGEWEFPWFAAVTRFQHNKLPRWKVVCGATLINKQFALTAGHCLHNRHKEQLEVVFNIKDVYNITSDPGVIRRKVKQFVVYPQFTPSTLHNDLALIKLKDPIDFSVEKKVVPICLPRNSRTSFAGRNGTFIGFGHTRFGSGSSGKPKENSRILMKVNVPIISYDECLRSKVPMKKNITEQMVCAGSHGKDACINDSGGPLMVQENGRTTLVGLASWGIGCGLANYPGVYTKVSQYLKWIKTSTEYVCGT